ncbi:MAG: glycosyltransferase family 2 protein [Proteobacteria bacterium]|nr:glycosyltransferase family 2 protein [Pseudomonadota bacterium]
MQMPLVSVVIPTRDRLPLLRRALASVLCQSEQNFEIIVVDDASSDGTPEYLAELAADDSRVSVVRNPSPRGGAGARNEGIAKSRGQWIAFLDDDDEWLPVKLEKQLHALQTTVAAVACSCAYTLLRESGVAARRAVPGAVTLHELLLENPLGGASMCVCSSTVLREIGAFDAGFASGQDLDLWVRLRQRGPIIGCAEALVLHRYHGGSRITTNMRSQYLGARYFYFKHRGLMDDRLRRQRIALTCFIMSQQPTRPLRFRGRYLWLSVRNAVRQRRVAYAVSSGTRLIRDALRGLVSA